MFFSVGIWGDWWQRLPGSLDCVYLAGGHRAVVVVVVVEQRAPSSFLFQGAPEAAPSHVPILQGPW